MNSLNEKLHDKESFPVFRTGIVVADLLGHQGKLSLLLAPSAAITRPSVSLAATLRPSASSTIMLRSTVSLAATLRLATSSLSASPDAVLRLNVLALLLSSVVMLKLTVLEEC